MNYSEPSECLGSNYLGAMKVAVETIEMSEDYADLLMLLANVSDIIHGGKIEAIFPPIE